MARENYEFNDTENDLDKKNSEEDRDKTLFVNHITRILRGGKTLYSSRSINSFINEIEVFCSFFENRFSSEKKTVETLLFKEYKINSRTNKQLYTWINNKYQINTDFVWDCLNTCMHHLRYMSLVLVTDFLTMIRLVVENKVNPTALLPFGHPDEKTRLMDYENYEKHLIKIIGSLASEEVKTESFESARSYIYRDYTLLGPSDKYLEKLISNDNLDLGYLNEDADNLIIVLHRRESNVRNMIIVCDVHESMFRIVDGVIESEMYPYESRPMFNMMNDSIRELLINLTKARYRQGTRINRKEDIFLL